MNRNSLLKAWRFNKWPGMIAASLGKPTHKNTVLLAKNFGTLFKPKNRWNTKYLYRGLVVSSPNNVKNIQGYSSWTTNLNIARYFSNRGRNTNRSMILRINTNLLKGISVLNSSNSEHEYVLPPMKMVLNVSSYNGRFLPVSEVFFNQKWHQK